MPITTSTASQTSFVMHIRALRQCLIQMLACFFLFFIAFIPWHKQIYTWISQPLLRQLPSNSQMIATNVTSTFVAPIQLVFFISFMASLPFLLWIMWRFIRPALFQFEKTLLIGLFLSAMGLFYLGVSLAYQFVLPTALHFFIHISPENVLPMTDIQNYLTFCLGLFFIFGCIFEIPVLIFLLVMSKLISVETLIQQRRLVIVLCFFIAMFITPPDALSMIILAIPMCLLFEIGLLVARIYQK